MPILIVENYVNESYMLNNDKISYLNNRLNCYSSVRGGMYYMCSTDVDAEVPLLDNVCAAYAAPDNELIVATATDALVSSPQSTTGATSSNAASTGASTVQNQLTHNTKSNNAVVSTAVASSNTSGSEAGIQHANVSKKLLRLFKEEMLSVVSNSDGAYEKHKYPSIVDNMLIPHVQLVQLLKSNAENVKHGYIKAKSNVSQSAVTSDNNNISPTIAHLVIMEHGFLGHHNDMLLLRNMLAVEFPAYTKVNLLFSQQLYYAIRRISILCCVFLYMHNCICSTCLQNVILANLNRWRA